MTSKLTQAEKAEIRNENIKKSVAYYATIKIRQSLISIVVLSTSAWSRFMTFKLMSLMSCVDTVSKR